MDENTIDLLELWYIVKKNIKKICKIAMACLVVAGLYLLIASPVYESEALLRIKQPKGLGSSLLDAVPGGNTMATKQLMSTYAEILKSRSVILPVIEATEEPNKEGIYPSYEGYIKGRIATVPFKDTEILKVTVNAHTPEKAQEANDLILQTFLTRLTELTRTEQRATKEFLASRVAGAKEELNTAEAALQKFKDTNHILSPTAQVTAVGDRIMLVDKVAAENTLNLATAQARLAEINSQLGGSARATADNDVIKGLNTRLAELEVKKVEYLEKYTEKHPQLQEVDAEIAGLRQQMQREFAKVAALQAPSSNPTHQGLLAAKFQSEAEIAVAEAKVGALKNVEEENNKATEKLSAKEQGYLKVARDAQVAEEIYIMLAKRLEEAKVAEVMVATEVQVVDTATLPEKPVKPQKMQTLAIAMILGLLLGAGYVIAIELFNRKMRTEEDVANYLDIPVLGLIPDSESLRQAEVEASEELGLVGKIRRFLTK